MTLQEAYGYYEVGNNYKIPQVPIWVVYSESHYSVLFAADASIESRKSKVDLYYWDMLAVQTEEIRLTVSAERSLAESIPDIDDPQALIPPLDLVIRTKWPGRSIDWNGIEPIL